MGDTVARKRFAIKAKTRKWLKSKLTPVDILGWALLFLGMARYTPLPHLPLPSLIEFHRDFAPELIGMGLTVLLIDWAIGLRQDDQLKEQLLLQMGSKHNEVTDTAVRVLQAKGWLADGSLRGVNLKNANLQEVYLKGADLRQANLTRANLTRAKLRDVLLDDACLKFANLEGAYLHNTRFDGADLFGANFNRAARLTLDQLRSACNLNAATMIDGTVIYDAKLNPVGITFEEWVIIQEALIEIDGNEEEE